MNLKKVIPLLGMAMCLTIISPAFAADGTPANTTETPTNEARAQQLMNRLIEIRDMDKSNLTTSEKRALRKEVKEMKREVRKNQKGIYLSVGAIIIIVLLLILLL
jgi:ABC-type transport system involved in cytochrome bd biosynthesis fused ATPase/permease subunit